MKLQKKEEEKDKSFVESKSSCAWKETVDTDILITSKNGNRKITQLIRRTSGSATRMRNGASWASSDEDLPKEYL